MPVNRSKSYKNRIAHVGFEPDVISKVNVNNCITGTTCSWNIRHKRGQTIGWGVLWSCQTAPTAAADGSRTGAVIVPRGAVGAIAFAGGHLAEGVILINPVRAVREGALRALVGHIIIVIVGERQEACPTGGGRNLRQAVQVIVCLAGLHALRTVVGNDNLAHKGRIGKQRKAVIFNREIREIHENKRGEFCRTERKERRD